MLQWFYTAAIKVTCADIGNCSTKTKTVGDLLVNATHALLFVIGMLAVIFIIVSGLQMAASAGNAKRTQQARDSLMYSVIGVVLAIVAYGVVSFIAGAI